MTKKLRTIDEILNDRTIFTQEQADRIEANALKEAQKYWGGKRAGAGRKSKGEYALNIQMKVNSIELEFLKQARELGANLKLIDLKKYAQ